MQKLGQHFLKNAAILIALGAKPRGKTATPEPLSIIEGDALKLLPEIVAQLPREARYKIVGNIPYYITGKLLRVVSELEYAPERVIVLIQEEVAERICAAPPAMNRLAASVQFWADATIIARVPRNDFSPPPKVDSAVIVLKNNFLAKNAVRDRKIKASVQHAIEPTRYYKTVRAIFAQPRKTLLNNLSVIAGKGVTKEHIITHLQKIGIDPAARPQDLSIEQIIAIAYSVLLE